LRWYFGGVQETTRAWLAGPRTIGPGILPLALSAVRIPLSDRERIKKVVTGKQERGVLMDSTMIVRIVAGVLVVVILAVLIQRRRTKVK
jgi:hypothetical protein